MKQEKIDVLFVPPTSPECYREPLWLPEDAARGETNTEPGGVAAGG